MNKPVISVIIPVYNVEAYVERCLESVRQQSFIDFECLVIDDGSTDSSPEIAEAFAKKDRRFLLIRQKNSGSGSARNRGIELARGEYLAFIDSDDWVHRDYLVRLYESLLNSDADIAVCNADRVWNSGRRRKNNKIRRKAAVITDPVIFLPNASMCVWDKLYKKYLFEDLKFPEGIVYEDFALTPQLLVRARKIVIIEDVLYFYYWRDNSAINQRTVSRDILKAFHLLEESDLKERCPGIFPYFFVKYVLGSLVWGILKEKAPFEEVSEIVSEGIRKYPGLKNSMDIFAAGKLKGITVYLLLHGQYKKAQKIVLLYEKIRLLKNKAQKVFG